MYTYSLCSLRPVSSSPLDCKVHLDSGVSFFHVLLVKFSHVALAAQEAGICGLWWVVYLAKNLLLL